MKDVEHQSATIGDRLLNGLGRMCAWLLLGLVILQVLIVFARYLLSINFLWLQELAIYLHAAIFMLAIAWTLMADRHVRLDVFWQRFSASQQGRINRIGTFVMLVPMMGAIFFGSMGYVRQSWSVLEGSQEVSGLPGLFVLKSLLLVMPMLVLVAAIARLRRRQG